MVRALEVLDLLDGLLRGLRGVAADVQQREHERGELVAQRDAGEAHADIGADTVDGERGGALVVVGDAHGDLVGERRSRRAVR